MSKRVVAFNVPQTESEVARVQVDVLPYFYDQLHQHPEIQIMYIESGEGTLIAGDFVGRFQSGDVFILGSGLPHVFRSDKHFYNQRGHRNSRSISLYFSEKYFGSALWGANELKAVREFAQASKQGLQLRNEAATRAREIITMLPEKKGVDRVVTFFTLLSILTATSDKKILSLQSTLLQTSEERRMNSILEFTFKESHRKIYITEVAQRANLSTEAFCRYFKLHTRKTYINFLHEVRISHACQLLIQQDYSMEQICYQTGFSNVSNFNRIFLKITGKTPRTFRQQITFNDR